MNRKPGSPRVTRRGGARSGTIALLATIAVFIGYFLPWTSWSGTIGSALALDKAQIVRRVSDDEQATRASQRAALGEAISGADWKSVLDAVEDSKGLEPRQERAVHAARIGVTVLPWAAVALALLLLLLSVPPRKIASYGFGPASAAFTLAQTRVVSTFLSVLVMAASLIVFLTSAVLVASATVLGEEGEQAGLGGHLMLAGSGVTFLSAWIGYGPGRLRATIFSLVIVAAIAIAVVVYTRA